MSEAALSLRSLIAHVDAASGALMRARFDEFAEVAAGLEAADLGALPLREGVQRDREAAEAVRSLRQSLERLGELLGHVAGVQLALRGLDSAHAAAYDRSGAGVSEMRRRVREEA